MDNLNVDALMFDVFGTAVDWHGSVTAELVALGQEYSFPDTKDDWASFATEWRQGYISNTFRVSQGGAGTTNVDQLHREILDSMLKSTRWSHVGDRLNEEERARLNLVWHRLNGWPDTVEGLHALKKHAIIATLSNGNVRLLVDMAKHANLPWDAIFSSELFGRFKPAPEAYLGALKNLSLIETPEKCAMVAAHLHDLQAAATHGIKTIYILRGDDKPGLGEVKAKKDGGEVDVVVNSFLELAKLFEHRN